MINYRWVERLDSLDTIFDLLEPVVECVKHIWNTSTFNTESITKANGLFHAVLQSDFIMSMIVCREILSYTRGLTVKLQGKCVELNQAYKDVQLVKETLDHIRSRIESYHRKWFDTAKEIATKLNTEIKMPRLCGRQQHRENVPAEGVEEYYRKSLSVPFLDHMIVELNTRFIDGQQHVPGGNAVIPELLQENTTWKDDFKGFTHAYQDDLESNSVEAELDLWERWWNNKSCLPATAQETLEVMDKIIFPNISKMLRLMCTLPVTTCECERTFSALRRLKTYMRSSMGPERLNGLALLHVHYSMDIKLEKVIDIFARKHPRRLTVLPE